MKNLICLASIFLVQAVLPLGQCTILPQDASLIDQTCKQTPYYSLCVSSLKSDPRSTKVDVTGLALIMVNVIKAKATQTQNQIMKLLQGSQDPGVQHALKSCASNYNTVINGDIPQATEALNKNNPKFAEQGANDAANEANLCENGFGGKSPLTSLNKVVHDASLVAASIVRNLL